MEQANVTPSNVIYTQARQTKLGMATVTITQEGDLYESKVEIVDGNSKFSADGIFSSIRESEIWAYGCKQEQNDYFSGYKRNGNQLIETKPAKSKIAEILTIAQALEEVQSNYDNFEIGRSSTPKGESVSVKSLTTSNLLSTEEQATMITLLAKLGKVAQ